MSSAWPALLGGRALQKSAARRITLLALVTSALVFGVGVLLHWTARPLVLSLLFIQAGALIARLYVAHVAVVHLTAVNDGIHVTKQGAPFLFVAYADIATATDDGSDVCVVLRSGDTLRFGIDGDERRAAVRAMQSALR